MQEKRIFERIEAPMKIKYEIVDSAPRNRDAVSKDISGGGIRLALEEKIGIGTNLKLEIELPGEKGKVITVYGRVVWVKNIVIRGARADNYNETGIEFTKADPISIGKIFKYFSGNI